MEFYYITYIGIFIFVIRTVFFFLGAKIERKKNRNTSSDFYPAVSVIVPARNEENNIQSCIESIFANNYPIEKFELIVVNDRSNDRTYSILSDLENKFEKLRVLSISKETADRNLTGKPGALQAGIEAATGEIILMTDADCIVGNNWIQSMVSGYSNSNIGLIAGVSITQSNNLFEKILAIEWSYRHTMGIAGFGLNLPLGCIGNNLSVRAEDFNKVGGYRKIKFSVTEDLSLLQAIVRTGKEARYLSNPDSTVITNPAVNFKQYLKQLHRWSIGGLELGWKAAVFVISSISLWLAIFSSVAILEPYLIAGIFCLRLLGDFSIIAPTLISINRKDLLKTKFLSILFCTFVELLVPFLLMNHKVVWKGQVFTRKK